MLIISTGGTFNKRYDPLYGTLLIDQGSTAMDITAKGRFRYSRAVRISRYE